MAIATPLFKHPRLVGVAAFQLSTDEVYRVVNDYTGLGRTGEMVIAARHDNVRERSHVITRAVRPTQMADVDAGRIFL